MRHAGADVRRPRLLSRTLPSPEPPADHEVPAPDPPSLLNSPSRVMCRLLPRAIPKQIAAHHAPSVAANGIRYSGDRCDLGPRERRSAPQERRYRPRLYHGYRCPAVHRSAMCPKSCTTPLARMPFSFRVLISQHFLAHLIGGNDAHQRNPVRQRTARYQ